MTNVRAPEPDIGLISELLDQLERQPDQTALRHLLAEHYAAVGWHDEARLQAGRVLQASPRHAEAQRLLATLAPKPASAPVSKPAPVSRPPVLTASDDFQEAFASFDMAVQFLDGRARVLEAMSGAKPRGLAWTQAWAQNVMPSLPTPEDVRVALAPMTDSAARDYLMAYLVELTDDEPDTDVAREAARQALQTVRSAWRTPEFADVVLMHFEHEALGRIYKVCGEPVTETMQAEAVAQIPRDAFWVTEDGYPWDVRELASALEASGLRFANPMTGALFTERDVAAILAHPEAARLRDMQAKQARLRRGLRTATIDRLKALGDIFAADDTADFAPSLRALDVFLATQAGLPAAERQALDTAVVQVMDTHTGHPWNGTVGDVLRQVRANTLCVHKAGSFLQQTIHHFEGV